MGLLLGIRLPENFNHPYLKPNLTRFWDSWHMSSSLSGFVPISSTRSGSCAPKPVRYLPGWSFDPQLATMTLIGLWHGNALNFVFWGIWHGLGLFINNRWSNATRQLAARIKARPWLDHGLTVFRPSLTFHYCRPRLGMVLPYPIQPAPHHCCRGLLVAGRSWSTMSYRFLRNVFVKGLLLFFVFCLIWSGMQMNRVLALSLQSPAAWS